MIDASINFVLARVLQPQAAIVAQADPSDTAVAKRAEAVLAGLQAGTIDRSLLSPELGAEYTPGVLANAAKAVPSGPPMRFAQRSKNDVDGVTTYVFRATWSAGTVDYVFGIDDSTGKIVKLFTRPGPPA
jgi:hypothetical protein